MKSSQGATVDGSEIRRSPIEVGSLSHYLQGFIHPRWCYLSTGAGFLPTIACFQMDLLFHCTPKTCLPYNMTRDENYKKDATSEPFGLPTRNPGKLI